MVADVATFQSDTPKLLTKLAGHLVGDLRRYFSEHRARIERTLLENRPGFDVARAYARLYDGVLSALFGACHAAMLQRGQWVPLSLGAVGSYGRRVLSPFSDLDVRLLTTDDPAAAAPAAEALLYPLWDAGLGIGHQVVAVDELLELAESDVTTATALLDWRTIAGESSFVADLLERAYRSVFDGEHLVEFLDRLETRAAQRHQRYGDSVYLLEPDVKYGAGGLRDLDIAHWCARARFRVAELGDLVGQGVLLEREWAEVAKARDRLLELRHALHSCAGRRTDRLTFDLQERVTERLVPGGGFAATERLMSDYYRAARVITRFEEAMLARARPAPRRRPRTTVLGQGLLLRDHCLALDRIESLGEDPALALRLYEEAIRRDVPVCPETRRQLMRVVSAAEFCEALRASPAAREAFVRLACVVQRTRFARGSVLGELHDVGLLVAMIPEFGSLVGRVHRDTYHVYTVDVHSVAAVDHVRAMCRGELGEHPLASRLAAELPRRQVLLLAALLHDIGKAYGGEGHTERGVEMSRVILERLDVPEGDIEDVQLLIAQHLSMYEAATRRDLEDPQTLSEFCSGLKERQMLHELYLLTIADVTTTNPTSMTNWKRRMLDSLFVAAERHLAGENSRMSARRMTVRSRVVSLWGEQRDRSFIEHFISGLPERYFYANEPEQILEHALFAHSAQSRAASSRRAAVSHPYFELWVVADDQPGLLAMITATLSHAKVKVRSAQVYSWIGQDGRSRSLDIFWLLGPEDPERAERLLSRLERDIERTIVEPLPADALERHALSGHRGSAPRLELRVPTEVNVDNKSASNYTVIEVITRDRPALLFVLSHALQRAGLSIWFAKINTEGERVIDVFYVSDRERGKVMAPAEIARVRESLIDAVQRLDARTSAAAGPGLQAAAP